MFTNPAHLTVLLLALCQALAMTGSTILFTTSALVGQSIAANQSLVTLPLALLQIATMVGTIPASLLMQRIGRQKGFMLGVLLGLFGAALAFYAIVSRQFLLFCGATLLFGSFNSFVGFYRFAAAETTTEAGRSQAISFVIAGGVIAAVAGPQLANLAKDWLPNARFSGSVGLIILLQFAALILLLGVKLPQPRRFEQDKGRSIGVIMRQPIFIVSVLGSMLGYGVMAFVMTATPLAMVADNHPFHDAANVMQWHVLGMFAPSFFTGALIARFGILPLISTGAVLSLTCIGINLVQSNLFSFTIALTLLGIGWNFLYIGSTTLLTQAYYPEEKAKTQAAHDFLMFAFVAAVILLSGSVYEHYGWAAVNLGGIPMMILVLGAIVWFKRQSLQPSE
ncbi:MFS transporter [Leptolyngbya ohadii]|uniref:MFS transporter n=1 Tax=Leptolyngbya ohadii TaxID=1962290 RepID=UPI000B59B92F|nr:MFS transporter [Leptolyngbya ohadii]